MAPLTALDAVLCGFDRAQFGSVKLCILVGTTGGGWVGWALAEDFGMMTAFLVSSVGSVVGVYVGWAVARRLLE